MKVQHNTVENTPVAGRFAPSPSGRMHLGNIFAALLSWLSAKRRGGRWILRIEDLDPQRSRPEYALLIEEDLFWLGLEFDEGGMENKGSYGPYLQSQRHEHYENVLKRLDEMKVLYRCMCTRSDIMATQAPHRSDGRVIYSGKCRPSQTPPFTSVLSTDFHRYSSIRLYVPDQDIRFIDNVCGAQCVNLATECGDFVVRRADGAWAYQLAVVADDAAMGVTEVVRGNDLLLSAAQQIYLFGLLGLPAPSYSHIPLLCNRDGQRLSKRDASLSMESLRKKYTPDQLIGLLAYYAGILTEPEPCKPSDLLPIFNWEKLPSAPTITITHPTT